MNNLNPNTTLKSKKSLPFHPVIFALFPPLALILENIEKVRFAESVQSILFTLTGVILVWIIASRIIRNRNKSAVITSIFFLIFFSYGHILVGTALVVVNFLHGWIPQMALISNKMLWGIFFASACSFLLISTLVVKSRSEFVLLNQFFNVMSIGLMLMSGYRSFGLVRSVSDTTTQSVQFELAALEPVKLASASPVSIETEAFPDIYYIILDSYARPDIAQEIFEIDNSQFVGFLEQSGFYIADESYANYMITLLSLSSSLNMTYIDEAKTVMGDRCKLHQISQQMINDNQVFKELREVGYTTYGFASGSPTTDSMTFDIRLAPEIDMSDFQHELINMTPLQLALNHKQYDFKRERILFTFDQASRLPSGKPKLVFIHVMVPHPPFIFGSDGEPAYPPIRYIGHDGDILIDWIGMEQYVSDYRDQYIYTTRLAQTLVAEILNNATNPPIIVLQSDHGSGARLKWKSVENTYIRERQGILNAYYFPDGDTSRLYPQITPVNTFRLIFSQYFGYNLPLLEDHSYFSNYDDPCRLINVDNDL